MTDSMHARTVMITGAGGDEIEAYLATPDESEPRGGVIVLHHMPGYDASTKEITRRFAALGYQAICPNLHYREAPGADPDDAAAASRAAGGVPDDRLVGDAEGAMRHLRALPSSNQKVGVIGYCSGGRQAFLTGVSLPVQAAVDCYGAFVVEPTPPGMPWAVGPLVTRAPELNCPLLGLFGVDDKHPSPEHVAELADALEQAGKSFGFHSFEGAGHGFFSVDRPAYRQLAAVEGWELVEAFFAEHVR